MANSGTVQQFQQPFQCKDCGLVLNSAESLDVHLQYHHKETLMQQWAGTGSKITQGDEKNNNMTKLAAAIKREFPNSNSVAAPADSSDSHKRSPEYHRTTPEGSFAQPPTPQSYHSGSSEYQNSAFSPNFQNFPAKSEGNSPVTPQQPPHFQNAFSNFAEQQQQFYPLQDTSSSYGDIAIPNPTVHNNLRYHPYVQQFERPKSQCGVPSASPAYPPQPTPSPSPKQCDKCGYVCESGAQLIEHTNLNHSNAHPGSQQYNQGNQHFMFEQQSAIKEEECSQSEILDLDSHKVVHPVWPHGKEEEKRTDSGPAPHSVSSLLNTWSTEHQHQQPGMYQTDHGMYLNDSGDHKIFPNIAENKMFQPGQKIFQPHQLSNQSFMNSGVSSSSTELGQQNYRPFEHLPTSGTPAISSSQVAQTPAPNSAAPTPPNAKGTNWKSNEARRPKTYNCSACNKWFTSSGHLKRHYNTTLHKNAVKASGLPDPASLPISAHHHPSRDSATSKDDLRSHSDSPREDSRGEDSSLSSSFEGRNLPGLLHNSYDRQGGPNLHHGPPGHSPLGQHHASLNNPGTMMQGAGFTNGGSPNGEAGLSSPESRGLLSMAPGSHGFNMMPQAPVLPAMEASQFQMYPNGSAPHVTQVMAITSNNTTGELHFIMQNDNQPLPSFAQLQTRRFSGGFANVGGLESVTVPISTYYTNEDFETHEDIKPILPKASIKIENTLSNGELVQASHTQEIDQYSSSCEIQYSPTATNNNHDVSGSVLYINGVPGGMHVLRQLSVTTDAQGESKENFNVGPGSNSPRVSSTVALQDESKTKCFDCDKVFNRPCYLTQHNKTCHNGEKPFKCARCGKRYATQQIFEEHTKKHVGDKPHKCDDCPKEFNHKTDLRRHKCCHTGKKPYACSICGKGFIRKDHMVKHMDTHARKKDKLSAMRN
ncbi:uncharacterized protein LOC115878654 [Sitophilus oryzae]|uniref:Uncharacterized protein LOC115878654 n=1 Tax=Sitophilus oryzae TaxID=7048 RepID=A0A6J2XHY2_SITOR|nr:uncharacterized protein LOC115878654 [Sitophilus oryzae]